MVSLDGRFQIGSPSEFNKFNAVGTILCDQKTGDMIQLTEQQTWELYRHVLQPEDFLASNTHIN